MDICPLSNQPCPHRRTTHVTEINNGQITELHLCENCAAKYPGNAPVQEQPKSQEFNPGAWAVVPADAAKTPAIASSLLSLLSMIAGGSPGQMQVQPKTPIYPPCPKCGQTTEEIRKTGKLGCAECYDHFGKAIMHVISHCQNAVEHVGKKPKDWDVKREERRAAAESQADTEDRIKSLKLKMAKAVEIENYEVAGVLKKKIEELQQKPSES